MQQFPILLMVAEQDHMSLEMEVPSSQVWKEGVILEFLVQYTPVVDKKHCLSENAPH
jgi:hypothetical protein